MGRACRDPGETMADRAAAGRGGADAPKVGSSRLTTPQWLDQRSELGDAKKDKVTTVKRYFPGQAPQWQSSPEEGEEEEGLGALGAGAAQPAAAPVPAPPVLLSAAPDAPRQVFAPQVLTRRREPEPLPAAAPEPEEEEDDEAIDRRRAAMLARARERRQQEAPELPPVDALQQEEEEEEESEWETDTDEELPVHKMIKPVFVPKAERESLAQRDALAAAEEAEAAREASAKAARKAESRLVAESLMERDAALLLAEEQAAPSDVDTDDEAHDAHEYDSWQLRELSRVTRDREERDKSFRDKEEMQRLRSMTEEEREEWDRTHPPDMTAEQRAAEKQKWSFMQKYYHKGAFFQSAADDRFGTTGSFDIYARDFGAATGEDKGFDRTMLPKAMQVRKGTFGRAGQVKWTHLAAEDTSRKDDIWAAQKRESRPTGANAPLTKPRHLAR